MSHAPTGSSIQNILHIKQVVSFSWKTIPSLFHYIRKKRVSRSTLRSFKAGVCFVLDTVFGLISPDFKKKIFFQCLFLRESERQSVSGGGAEREGDTESEAGSGLGVVITEPDAGPKPTNREIMS